VLPLHSTMVLPPGTRGGHLSTVCWIRITLAITWPHGHHDMEATLSAAAQVHGGVRRPLAFF
jgi:hypothetical protein